MSILVVVFMALAGVLVAVMGSGEPGWALSPLGLDATRKTQAIEFIGIAMGGVLLVIGATIANRRAVAMENAAKAQAEAAAQQAKANEGAEAGRRQERLKTAIEHLGHASDSVRLGGAYELFHLAQDSEDLRQTVLDILCAHIRWTTGKPDYREEHKVKPSTEVQSLLTLLFVQEHEVFEGCRIDLQGSWLNGADLFRARLQRAALSWAHLQGARLGGAHLQVARFFEAHLQGAGLLGARLQWAYLHGAQLQGAILSSAQLQGANLRGAQLQGANLFMAQLQGANLPMAQLQGADLSKAQLQGAGLFMAQLQGADLLSAQLQGADLTKTQLQGAISQLGKYKPSLRMRIHDGIGRESDLSGATFAGGLSQDDVASLVEGLINALAKEELLKNLEPHVGKPVSHELPEDCGAITGAYTKQEAMRWVAEYEEAMRWVAEYEEAMGGVPPAGGG